MESDAEDCPPLLVDTHRFETDSVLPQESSVGESDVRVPITIVTGYLGAGKTTLLNYILRAQHGKKIAIILNEFGDSADIEKSLTINKDGEEVQEWLEVGNGCICCSVKDSGVNAIESLMEKKGAFDYILLETTGLADPGNIAPLFWVDEGLGSSIYLDGIVTLVDAKNILKSLDEVPAEDVHVGNRGPPLATAHLQISHADVIVINKSDLVSNTELEIVRSRVRAINGLAKVHITQKGEVPQLEGMLLDLHAYDDVGSLDVSAKGHSHLDKTISTVTVEIPQIESEDMPAVDEWLRSILWDRTALKGTGNDHDGIVNTFEIHRLKARILLSNGGMKLVQGVREVFEIIDGTETGPSESIIMEGKAVIIGRGLEGVDFRSSLLYYIRKR